MGKIRRELAAVGENQMNVVETENINKNELQRAHKYLRHKRRIREHRSTKMTTTKTQTHTIMEMVRRSVAARGF